MQQKEFQKLEDLEVGNTIKASLPIIEYEGFLYMTGYSTLHSAGREDITFLGIRRDKKEEYCILINPKEATIINNVITQKKLMHPFILVGILFGGSVKRLPNGKANEINVDTLQETLQRLDIRIIPLSNLPDKIISHPTYRNACRTLQELI
ncbi:MAG: hypothetical protein AABX79_02870 [Nanoarchaeota archaeon]